MRPTPVISPPPTPSSNGNEHAVFSVELGLVPYCGACIQVTSMFEPVWVTGTLQTTSLSSDLGEVGYMMTLDQTEPYEF